MLELQQQKQSNIASPV